MVGIGFIDGFQVLTGQEVLRETGVGDDAKGTKDGGVGGECCRIPAIAKSFDGYR
jgi:hypothetical protein